MGMKSQAVKRGNAHEGHVESLSGLPPCYCRWRLISIQFQEALAMRRKALIAVSTIVLSATVLPQSRPQKPGEEQPIRISTQLVQLDAVVTDKNGQVVRGLTKSDFELYESGRKQLISFFEFVDAIRQRRARWDLPPARTFSVAFRMTSSLGIRIPMIRWGTEGACERDGRYCRAE